MLIAAFVIPLEFNSSPIPGLQYTTDLFKILGLILGRQFQRLLKGYRLPEIVFFFFFAKRKITKR